MANSYRNETEIQLNGNSYLLRPTFSCLAEIEDYFQTSVLLVLSTSLGQGKLTIKQLYVIIAAGIKGAGAKVNKDQLEFDITQTGTVATTQEVAKFLSASIQSADSLKKS